MLNSTLRLFSRPFAVVFVSAGLSGPKPLAWSLVGILVVVMFLDWCIHNQLIGKLQFGRLNILLVAAQLTSLCAIVVFVPEP